MSRLKIVLPNPEKIQEKFMRETLSHIQHPDVAQFFDSDFLEKKKSEIEKFLSEKKD